MDSETLARLAYLALLMAAVGGWVMVEYRGRMGLALRSAFAWGMIVIGLMAAYGLWQDIRQDLLPKAQIGEGGEIRIPRAEDGHYYMTVEIGGQPVAMMADTGATRIVLTEADARSLGFDPARLVWQGEARTANGVVRTAHVTLPDLSFGPYRDSSVSAWVNGGQMDLSLLGMDYLGRFRIEIAGGEMILRR